MTHTRISEPSSPCCVASLPQEVVGTRGEQCLQWLCSIKPQRWVLLWHWQGRKFHGHFGCLGSMVANREACTEGAVWPGPCVALTGVTYQRQSLKAGGKTDVGGRERMLPSYSPVPGKDALQRICRAGDAGRSQVPSPAGCAAQSTEHPAPWCQFRTLWDVQGDASRHPCVPTAMAAVLGLLEKQQSKPQAFLASIALAFCLQLISSWF